MSNTQPTHRTITDDIRDIREGQTPAAQPADTESALVATKTTKCDPDNGDTCPTLKRMLTVPNSTGKGFHAVIRGSLGELKASGVWREHFYGIAYRGGKSKGEYCFINHCPFCGAAWRPGEIKVLVTQEAS